MTATTKLRAGAPVSVLLRHLRRAGWGALSGRQWQGLRSTLVALADRVGDNTGRGLTTAEQIAAGAGLSEKWTRRCLTRLEEIGVLTWQRGGIIERAPEPSAFRISKTRLLELIEEARPERDKAVMLRRQETAARLAQLRVPNLRSKSPAEARLKRFRRSVNAELRSNLPPNGEEPVRRSAPQTDSATTKNRAKAVRDLIRPMRTPEKTRQEHTAMSRTTDLRRIPLTVDPDTRPVVTVAEAIPAHLAHLVDPDED